MATKQFSFIAQKVFNKSAIGSNKSRNTSIVVTSCFCHTKSFLDFEVFDDASHKRYKKYLTKKASLREPAVTRQLASLAHKLGKDFISLAEGAPNAEVFPFREISTTLRDGTEITLTGSELTAALQYIPSLGLPSLIDELKGFQERTHNPPDWSTRDIIVTNGSQDGIYKCVELLLENGDPIIVPIPTYSGVDGVLKPLNAEVIGIPEDDDGMVPEELGKILAKRRETGQKIPKLMYVIPTGSNPSGSVLPNSRRRAIYAIACKFDIIILEDDPYRFMNFCEEVPVSFLSMDVEGRVLRLDSLSKVLSSGFRLGWVTGPKPLIHVLELHMQASNLHGATLTQTIIYNIIKKWGDQGLFQHFDRVKQFYRMKRDDLQEILQRHLSDLAEWNVPKAGMFFWVKVKGVDDVKMVVKRAFESGLLFVPGNAFIFDQKRNCPYIRMTFSKARKEDMDIAIRHLAELIREEQKRTRMQNSVKA